MHIDIDAVQARGSVGLALVSSNVPVVARWIFYAGGTLTVFLVFGLINRGRARLQGTFVNCVAIRNIEVDRVRVWGGAELTARNAATHHDHGITNAHFAMQAAC